MEVHLHLQRMQPLLAKGNKPQWLMLQKDKDAQQSWAIAVDIAGALSN